MEQTLSEDDVWLDAAGAAGQRLDRFVADCLPQYSRSRIQRWIALGAVGCESRALTAKSRLAGNEKIWVQPQPHQADQAFTAQALEFPVVYDDDSLIVVNKPAGMVVHPAPGNWSGTLMNGLQNRYPELAELPRAGIVHRLDKNTTGLMVVARTESARSALVAQLSERTVARLYVAVCLGSASDVLADGAIGRDPRHRQRMAVRHDGRPAHTVCDLLRTGSVREQPVSLMRCRLRTGRTHQIRVHMAHAGHPLVGDTLYGGRPVNGFERQALHAVTLGLVHPALDSWVGWQAAPPADLLALLDAAGWSDWFASHWEAQLALPDAR